MTFSHKALKCLLKRDVGPVNGQQCYPFHFAKVASLYLIKHCFMLESSLRAEPRISFFLGTKHMYKMYKRLGLQGGWKANSTKLTTVQQLSF